MHHFHHNISPAGIAFHNINGLINRQNARMEDIRFAEAEQAAGRGTLPPRADQERAERIRLHTQAIDQNWFHWTVTNGTVQDLNSIATCLRFGRSSHLIDEVARDGTTGLQFAAQENKIPFVHAFLANGANVNAYWWQKDSTALLMAANRGHADVVNVLLENGARHDFAKKDGCTALHGAAQFGHADVASVLISKGADLHAKTKDGCTALHWAANFGNADVVNVLIAKGADPHAAMKDGTTALQLAATADVVNALQGTGTSTSAPVRRQQTPPHEARSWQSEASHSSVESPSHGYPTGNVYVQRNAPQHSQTPRNAAYTQQAEVHASHVQNTSRRDARNNFQAGLNADRQAQEEFYQNQHTVGCCTIS